MASLTPDMTLQTYLRFIDDTYRVSNDRYFSLGGMLTNVERFVMRGLKGIRKNDREKIILNLLISFSWFASFVNRFHIDIETEVWRRFPGVCSYCGASSCLCGEKKPRERQGVQNNEAQRPITIRGFQQMFETIYPAQHRSLEKAGIHLAEEMGELSEALLAYRGRHDEAVLNNVALEAADFFSCLMGVFNSLNVNIAEALAALFEENCHVCNQSPCQCNFDFIMNFTS